MARTPTNFTHNNQLSTAAESLYTPSSTSESATIRKLSFYNSNATTNRTVTVYVVEASGAADTGTTLAVRTIPPLKTWNCVEAQGEVISGAMSLQAKQDAGTDVNVNSSGTLIT